MSNLTVTGDKFHRHLTFSSTFKTDPSMLLNISCVIRGGTYGVDISFIHGMAGLLQQVSLAPESVRLLVDALNEYLDSPVRDQN